MGRDTLSKPEDVKTDSPIAVSDVGNETDVNETQLLNTLLPNETMLVGIVADVIEHPLNALFASELMLMSVEMTITPLQQAIDGEVESTQSYVTVEREGGGGDGYANE